MGEARASKTQEVERAARTMEASHIVRVRALYLCMCVCVRVCLCVCVCVCLTDAGIVWGRAHHGRSFPCTACGSRPAVWRAPKCGACRGYALRHSPCVCACALACLDALFHVWSGGAPRQPDVLAAGLAGLLTSQPLASLWLLKQSWETCWAASTLHVTARDSRCTGCAQQMGLGGGGGRLARAAGGYDERVVACGRMRAHVPFPS